MRPPLGGLALYLGYLVLQRIAELRLSARHGRVLLARGALERGRAHFPLLVAIHALYPIALLTEVLGGGARPPAAWPLALTALIGAEAVRLWSMAALGEFWNLRVLVVPGAPRIRRGPYRWFAHPNYAAVALEFVAGPLMFGAWRTALVFTALNAIALAVRVRCENRALAETHAGPASQRAATV